VNSSRAELEETETEVTIKRDGDVIGKFQRLAVLGWWKEPGDPSPAAVAKFADLCPKNLNISMIVLRGASLR
jgi:hypothetical protein